MTLRSTLLQALKGGWGQDGTGWGDDKREKKKRKKKKKRTKKRGLTKLVKGTV